MAVTLMIRAKRSKISGGGTHYEYPPEYDSQKIQVLCYESVGENDKVTLRDKGTKPHEFLIGVVSDEDAPGFLKSPDINVIGQASAIEKGRRWRPQVEKILDQNKVLMVLAKVARGEVLTKGDKDAINPDNTANGINKSQKFDDLLAEHMR